MKNQIKTTEKMYWVNGISKRGTDFYSISISFINVALLITFSLRAKCLGVQIFKLIK